jgi:hypothetical protein
MCVPKAFRDGKKVLLACDGRSGEIEIGTAEKVGESTFRLKVCPGHVFGADDAGGAAARGADAAVLESVLDSRVGSDGPVTSVGDAPFRPASP